MSCGAPIDARNVSASPAVSQSSSTFKPAGVSIVTSVVPGRSRTASAARQRMPLPETSDGLPSALKRRMLTEDRPKA